jgi:glycosyltransferase involved in cell wall biosynthesis
VLTSKWEGFGLTVLEGLASGRPVVASGVSSVPEVGGDAAAYGQPGQPETYAAALQAVLGDPHDLERRRTRGLEIAASYSWKSTAEKTLEGYRLASATSNAPA